MAIPDGINALSVPTAAVALGRAGFFVGPVKAGTKNPGSLLGGQWQDKTSRDPDVIGGFFARWPAAGVFIHTGPSGLVVFDLDATDSLDDLPAVTANQLRTTVFQRSREGARGHYLFRTDGERLSNAAGEFSAWGDVRANNGVIIVGPTVHPTTGQPYVWERTGAVPTLPAEMRALLRAGGEDARPAMDAAAFAELVAAHTDTASVKRLQGPLNEFVRRVSEGESRHNALLPNLAWAVREAREGYFPLRHAVDAFRAAYEKAFDTRRAGGRSRPAPNEFDNILRWVAAQPDDRERADQLWDLSPVLRNVRRIAQEKFITPHGLLAAGLLRALIALPPSHVLPAIVGSTAPPNMFLGLVGDSGTGKGITEDTAAEWFTFHETIGDDVYRGKPGSGEGIPKMFGGWESIEGQKRQELVFWHTRAYLHLPEIDSIRALFGRDNSTLSATLREAWSGSTLGNDYATPGRKVLIRSRRYRLCMSIGIQPERSGPLFEDSAGGLPQRFMFAAMADPRLPDPSGVVDDLRPIELPVWGGEDPVGWRETMGAEATPADLTALTVPEEVRREVLAARARAMRAQSGGLDGHRLLLMEKVALGFAVLHGRTDGFDIEHWRMAELMMVHSDLVRDGMLSALAEAAKARATSRARQEGAASAERDAAADEANMQKTTERVLTILSELPGGKALRGSDLNRKLSKVQREYIEDVLEALLRDNRVLRDRRRSGGTEGYAYRLRSEK